MAGVNTHNTNSSNNNPTGVNTHTSSYIRNAAKRQESQKKNAASDTFKRLFFLHPLNRILAPKRNNINTSHTTLYVVDDTKKQQHQKKKRAHPLRTWWWRCVQNFRYNTIDLP